MVQLDNKKICFIICTNDEQQLEECLMYLNLLEVPEGFSMEILTITDAKSMASGYNEGMRASDAKYKVYLHQDTFIVERKIIEKLLKVFQKDKKIGMVGVIGAEKLSKDGVIWHEERCGDVCCLGENNKLRYSGVVPFHKGIKEVEVIEGLFMATQYDVTWRDDVFTGWHFYDVSQSLEFRRQGYKVVVPGQKSPWVMHMPGRLGLQDYNIDRKRLLDEYPEIEKDKNYKRILFVHSQQIVLMGLSYSLVKLGHSVQTAPYRLAIFANDPREVEMVEETLEEGNYDLVVTYDFIPSVSVACERNKVKYYAWVYDSPLLELYREEAKNQYTYISVFDKKQYSRLMELKRIPHLYHLPLATEVKVFGTVKITKKDEKKYASDIAFVGRLYDNRGYDELFDENSRELQMEADKVIADCDCYWNGENNLFGKASEQLIEHISSKINQTTWNLYDMDKRYYCESMKLVRRCNEVERVRILNTLATKHKVVLYADKVSTNELNNIEVRPWVDYWSEMPKVFYLSKININITSRSIESGIPQRVWDIMAVGGFCLTNYQPELEEYFEIGKDIVVYYGLDDLQEKVDYYLAHEQERIQIAINGYKKVRANHELRDRLKEALDFVFAEENA